MFPLWDVAIAPVVKAVGARRIVEIGALRGETTVKMLDELGPQAELHVIDPAPEFDPAEHEQAFPGRYVFHRATSLDVLGSLPPVDVALVDGDHNWYTVYNELKLLADGARREGAALPVLILHDVLWPYGRRDLYYAPERIPAEFRQPYSHGGMRPGRRKLFPSSGLNPTMWNAEVEGGRRNGVMTALDDFVDEYDRPLRRLVLPVYFGLAIVVEEERLARTPELGAVLEHLESADGRFDLMEVAEGVRLQAMVYQHNVVYKRGTQLERARDKHLDLVKDVLLDRHYLETEVRIAHLEERLQSGRPVNAGHLRDPVRTDRAVYERLQRERFGVTGPDDAAVASFLPYTAMGKARLDHLHERLDAVRHDEVEGDLVECGTGRGGGAILMRAHLDVHGIPDRRVWVLDEFRAANGAPDGAAVRIADLRPDLNFVRDGFDRFDLLDERVRFLLGPPGEKVAEVDAPVALLRIGRDAASNVDAILRHAYDLVADGGVVMVDVQDVDELDTVEAFRRERGIDEPLARVDAGCVSWRKGTHEPASVDELELSAGTEAVSPSGTATDALDLTVVVVFHDMRREAARTLHSLSRAYQEGIGDLRYEVIAIDNGSSPDRKVERGLVESFGPEFRYVDMGDGASTSPVPALNAGIAAARGAHFALMIDGAHVVTPGVLRFGMAALRTYAPAVVATQQWYVGPGQQGDAIYDGYDTAYEDRLFDTIDWPHDGYRLFEIGHFIGDRDWFDGMWESNCLFAPRALVDQVGGFDESFSMPGGGYANLELYERLGSSPDVTVATILGEGSFHQLHGGTTTNQADAAERRSRVFGYSRHYAEQRGRAFRGPGKPIHFVGRITSPSIRRTKSRRRTADAFTEAALVDGDGLPQHPVPVPDDLRTAFTEAVWNSVPWDRTTWLGRRVRSAPGDLLAYQELIAAVRPDWIVETGTGDGGRALFLASICELVEHGQVLSVDDALADDLPQHPRLQYLKAAAHSKAGLERINRVVEQGRALVVLGSGIDGYRTSAQFEGLASLVPVGSYVVVTDTIVNGHPVWPAFGHGPAEAVKKILTEHGDFVADPLLEKYSLTFNPGGFLKRVE